MSNDDPVETLDMDQILTAAICCENASGMPKDVVARNIRYHNETVDQVEAMRTEVRALRVRMYTQQQDENVARGLSMLNELEKDRIKRELHTAENLVIALHAGLKDANDTAIAAIREKDEIKAELAAEKELNAATLELLKSRDRQRQEAQARIGEVERAARKLVEEMKWRHHLVGQSTDVAVALLELRGVLDEKNGSAATAVTPSSPDDLRALGWSVAVHNDYRLSGRSHTFWLLTMGDRCVKGEGHTDTEALDQIRVLTTSCKITNT